MKIFKFVLIAGIGLVAACSPPTEFPETEGISQKDKMDLATKFYSDCIAEATDVAAVNVDPAGTIADRVVLACKKKRNTLLAEVVAFHQIGHPKFSIEQSKAVAEASIATIEDELRRQVVVSIVSRQLGATASSPDQAATVVPQAPPGAGGVDDASKLKLQKKVS